MIKLIERFGSWIVDLVLRWRWLSLLFMVLLTIGLSLPMKNLGMSTEYRDYFGPENPQLLTFDNLETNYTKIDAALFVVQPADKKIFSQESYPIVQKITELAWQLPGVARVDSISNYQHTEAASDELLVGDLLPLDESFTDEQLASKEAIALAEPTIAGSLISHNGATAGINARVDLDNDPDADLPDFIAAARAMIEQIEAEYPGIRIASTGNAFMSNAFVEAAGEDALTLIPFMYVVLFIVMTLVYRNTYATLITIAVVLSSTLIALGVGGIFRLELNSISVSLPIVVMTLAVADSVHILVTLLSLMRGGMDKMQAIRESMRINFVAVAVTSITTIIGFMCLNFSDTPPFWHLGNLSAVGIFAAWVASVMLIPALVAIVPIKVKMVTSGEQQIAYEPVSLKLMRRLARLSTVHSNKIIVASGLISVVVLSAIPRLEFDDQFIDFFSERLDFRTDTDFTIKELSGIYTVHYDIRSAEPAGITSPEYLQHLQQFSEWLRSQPEVRAVYSFTDVMLRLNKSMHGDDPAWYRLPEDQELAAQYLLIYELSLPYGLDMNDRLRFDKSGTRLTATLDKISSVTMRDFAQRSNNWLRDNLPAHMYSEPSGTAMMFAYITKRNLDSMVLGNIIAVVLISLVMMIALEHFGLGLLSMVPNMLPIVFTFGLWYLLLGSVGMSSAIVMALSLGIVVDNTTHFLSKYQRARREKGATTEQAIHYAFEVVGMALLANAIILAAGFGILGFSSFQPNVQMGIMVAITIVLALIIDLLLLPALLMLRARRRKTIAPA
ncbi:MAG: MMPL family transporter [Gammaproteobacteria bacterium]|nr:MMPL family transporter [Gammaproteobacteria bacterium]